MDVPASVGDEGGGPPSKKLATEGKMFEGTPLDEATNISLRLLLFGEAPEPTDVDRWHTQGFTFSGNEKISWGLTQLYGGPCGILAPVQAWVLRDLIFEQKIEAVPGAECPLRPTPEQTQLALLRALTTVLSRATDGNKIVIVTGTRDALYSKEMKDEAEARSFLEGQLALLRSDVGVIMFVYSLLLSRTIERIKADMDDPTVPLVGRFGHCTQEIVNLMLTGQAVSNVFDGRKVLDGDPDDVNAYALKGISAQNELGFLTLLEAHRLSHVGQHLKQPKLPIWVVGSATHYTVLFGTDAHVNVVSEEEKQTQQTRRLFDELDPTGNGFIQKAQLGALLARLGIDESVEAMGPTVDPDGYDICLWENVLKAVQAYATRPKDWACSACTFINASARATCDMCATARPAAAPSTASSSGGAEAKAPREFVLYHFNGIDGHGKAVAECCRVSVSVLDADVSLSSGDREKKGLRDAVLTRWPNAIVEYVDGVEPKIA